MTAFDRRKVEMEWKQFQETSLTPPRSCSTVDELRASVAVLCQKIEEYQVQVGYVPAAVYSLLAQYNQRQNKLLDRAFQRTYGTL